MRSTWLVGVATLASLASLALGAAPPPEPAPIPGRVESAVLYRGQALVTRRVPVAVEAGRGALVVGNLPEQVVGDSLFAEGGEGVEVRSVRYRTRAVGEAPREEVRQLEQAIQEVEDQAARNKRMQELVSQRLKFLESLEGFTAPTAKAELAKGVLDFEALEKLTLFAFQQRQEAAEEALRLDAQARDLGQQLSVLQRRRAELTAGYSRTVREAVVFLEKRGAAASELQLSYLVGQAGWSPAYNFRAAEGGEQTAVEYNAVVRQMSGEDWDSVALTLSTASPALTAQGPGLAPFRVALSKAPPKGRPGGKEYAQQLAQAQSRLHQAEQQQRAAQALRESVGYNWEMNVAANEAQGIELTADRDALATLQAEPELTTDVTSVTYQLDGPVSLASRSDQQMLRIDEMNLPSTFTYVATPILTSYVYREAELSNTAAEALLGGQVTVYLDGRFVGRGEIPTVARGETFVVGFGADPQLRARRELVDKTESVQGGNREIRVHYRIPLENYKQEPAVVRVYDRIPVAQRESEIRVTLDETAEELSDDPLYLRVERPKGILRWDVEVPAGAAGEDARTLEYSYTVEFDRTLHLSTPLGADKGQASELREEFERLQQKRSLK
ncbi:MAG: mucoidy inhibitor MuiA family protein [Candidatus Brocadiia bacterium]